MSHARYYDPKCLELATHFLEAPIGPRQALAAYIQNAIEDWMHGYEADVARDEPEDGA